MKATALAAIALIAGGNGLSLKLAQRAAMREAMKIAHATGDPRVSIPINKCKSNSRQTVTCKVTFTFPQKLVCTRKIKVHKNSSTGRVTSKAIGGVTCHYPPKS